MNISRKKFVIIFLISAILFTFSSNALFGTDARVFPKPPEPFIGTPSPVAWKNTGYKLVYPIKFILIGPMFFTGNFLREDPPPPFVLTVFALYWSILALIIYLILGIIKVKKGRN